MLEYYIIQHYFNNIIYYFLFINSKYQNDLKGDFFILAKLKLSMLEKFLGTNKFFAGENVSINICY